MPTRRVFEHSVLPFDGDFRASHAARLQRWAEAHQRQYCAPAPGGVRFFQYVGLLRVGDLTIEVVPKADRAGDASYPWQTVLPDLLRYCGLTPPRLTATAAGQSFTDLLDGCLDALRAALETLVRQGLRRAYRPTQRATTSLRGRIRLHAQLAHEGCGGVGFQVTYPAYTDRHAAHAVLRQACEVARAVAPDAAQRAAFDALASYFPADLKVIPDIFFGRYPMDRARAPYAAALRAAAWLLRGRTASARAGDEPVFGWLFNMNHLFETFVARQLAAFAPLGWRVSTQPGRRFWQDRFLRPDLLLTDGREQIVVDTKWDVADPLPAAHLHQLFAYVRCFGATRGALVRPAAGVKAPQRFPFQDAAASPAVGEVHAWGVWRDGRLDVRQGAAWWAALLAKA